MPAGTRRKVEDLKVSKERALELLDFDRETGIFTWKAPRRGTKVGARAGSVDPNGYRYIRIDGYDILAQRLAWLIEYDTLPDIIRFKDGNRDNCSISNMRDGAYVEQGKHDWRTKEGKAAQQKEYRATVPGQLRDYRYRTEFGISLEDYNRMHAAQGGLCAICGKPEEAKRNGKLRYLAVDHCHDTGKVRGLLCGKCNPMIGYADHRIGVLEQAIDYLRRTNGSTE